MKYLLEFNLRKALVFLGVPYSVSFLLQGKEETELLHWFLFIRRTLF